MWTVNTIKFVQISITKHGRSQYLQRSIRFLPASCLTNISLVELLQYFVLLFTRKKSLCIGFHLKHFTLLPLLMHTN